jgi:hypothetical protein
VLVEEVQEHLVRLLIIGLDGVVLEITTSGHEAVDLVREPFDSVLGLDSLLPLLDIILRLIFRRQHDERNGDTRGVVRIDHGWVAGRGSLEQGVLLRAQVDDLAPPAVTDHSPLLDAGALSLNFLQDLRDALESLGRRSLGVEELAELLALLFVVRRVPGNVGRLAVEEVWSMLSAIALQAFQITRSPLRARM